MFRDARAISSFSTNDIAKAKKFYGETLGLNLKESMGGLELTFKNGGQVFIYPKPNHEPATFTVLNLGTKDVEAAVAALKERGVRFETYDMPDLKTDAKGIARGHGGPTQAWFKDPGGNILSVIEMK